MTNFTYAELLGIRHPLYVTSAGESMNKAASAVGNNENVTDIDAMEHSNEEALPPLNGVVTCIERKKNEVLTLK